MDKKQKNFYKKQPIIKNRLSYCRRAVGLRQKDIAFLMGLPVSQISRWERGKREPGIYNALGLAAAAGRLVEDIFFDYRREWQEKITQRKKQVSKNEEGNQGASRKGASK